MSETEIMDPKKMTPRCAALWGWYKTLPERLRVASHKPYPDEAVEYIIEEIESHAVEIEYQCRI